MLKLGIISGSHRKDAQSLKVAKYIEGAVARLGGGVETDLLSLSENPLPLWDESIWEGAEKWKALWGPVAARLKACDGFVVVSPEWAGMVPSGLKNFFLLCSAHELGHKPGLIVTVSASGNGAYPVAELRMSSYKNNYLCYIPDHVIVRNVEKVFNTPNQAASPEDEYLRKRMDYSLKVLTEFSKALRSVRASGATNYKEFPFGM